jgi:hypothetical protein
VVQLNDAPVMKFDSSADLPFLYIPGFELFSEFSIFQARLAPCPPHTAKPCVQSRMPA